MGAVEDFQQTLNRQLAAYDTLYLGDPGAWMALWSRRDPVSLFGAWGPCKTGWDELSRTFHWVASRFTAARDSRFDIEVAEVSGDLAYTVGYERAEMSIDGGPMRPWTVRVTHIYRREDGEWKLVHRHGDFPPEDQSPTG
jgi:ketosteroid isomerase-like protein